MRAEAGLVRAHGLAALGTILLSVTFGLIASIQLWLPDLGAGTPALSWGRIRYAHTQGIMLGWLANSFFAFLYYAVPKLTGRPVTSERLGWWLFGLWNLAVMVPGWVLVLAGVSQPLEWAEFPLIVDAFVWVGLILAGIQFLPGFFARGLESLYVSSWYVIGALVFTVLSYPMGNIVPEFVPGAAGAAFSGLWIHDAVGLFVTPLALAILYFVIPASTGKPIYKHSLSMLGFWLLFFLYPLNGTHHYIYSVIPMPAQVTAITASALLGVTVILVVTNLLMSLRGAGVFPKDVGLRFVVMSTIFYLVVSVQGSLQAFMAVNQVVHFTDWVIGHSHLAMLGFATFASAGGLVHAWERTPGVRFNATAINRAYWWLFAGLLLMVIDLTVAGLIQAQLWHSGAPWIDSVVASKHAWITRSATGLLILGGFLDLLRGLMTGALQPSAPYEGALQPSAPYEGALQPGGLKDGPLQPSALNDGPLQTSGPYVHRMAYLSAFVAGVGFFVFSVASLGVWPTRTLDQQARDLGPEVTLALTASEERGRDIYAREGCSYCHTQQIRFTAADQARFGAPTLAWEGGRDYPHMLGTRRIGPDLSRTGSTRSEDWHLAHLYDPRLVVPESVMPAYRHLFSGDATMPRQEARDLVAYLETLGRARELAEGSSNTSLNASPARPRRIGDVPALPPDGDAVFGEQLYGRYCVTCHGVTGQGEGPAAMALIPRPANLRAHWYSNARLAQALWHGGPGTSMPAWRDLPREDLAALVAYIPRVGLAADEMKHDRIGPTDDQRVIGARVYAENCAQCHGARGAGDGWAAHQLTVPPTNFRQQKSANAVQTIRDGVEGTMMASWSSRLSEDEMMAVALYVGEFFREQMADDARARRNR